MENYGELYALAALILEEGLDVNIKKEAWWDQEWAWTFWRRKFLLFLLGIEPEFSSVNVYSKWI